MSTVQTASEAVCKPVAGTCAPALTPMAQRILAHLQGRASATMADLRKVTRLATQPTKEAAYELCRAGLATAEWGGVRFRLRDQARAQA